MEDGEITEDAEATKDIEKDDSIMADPAGDTPTAVSQSDRKPSNIRQTGWSRNEGNRRSAKMVNLKTISVSFVFLFQFRIEAHFLFNFFGAITSILIVSLCFQDFEAPVAEHVPRVLPKNEDPSLVNRNKRMLGQLIGTLEVCV